MEQIFRNSLHEILTKSIRGKIKIYINKNSLEVNILTTYTVRFRYTVDDFQTKLCYGLTSEFLAREILFEYKKFIKKLFFL